jgi:hypothetical protein
MTYLEKLKRERPEERMMSDGFPIFCPHAYWPKHEYDSVINERCTGRGILNPVCSACWNREIPEPKNNEREENTMNESTPTLTTRKTKADLLKDIAELNKQVEHLDKYKQLEEAADMTAAMCKAYETAGFSREEAFELTKIMIELAAKTGRM